MVFIGMQKGSPSSALAEVSRAGGFALLEDFLPKVRDYAARRNFDSDEHPTVSGLSPYLRHRLLIESEVIGRVLEHAPLAEVEKFVEEVCWRTYWKGWLETHPSVWSDFVAARVRDRHRLNSEKRALLDHIRRAHTGIACFDHWTRQLLDTGYLHNHARMWFASIWIFTFELPWSLGADFFLRHLIDGDPASNTLSWRWVAGLHTPGKYYVARARNIARYTNGRFDPEGVLNEDPVPLAESAPPPFVPLAAAATDLNGVPSLSDSPAGLLVIDDDLAPEVSKMEDWPFSSVAILHDTSIDDEFGYDERVLAFRRAARADAAARACAHWGGELRTIEHLQSAASSAADPAANVSRRAPLRVYTGETAAWIDTVVRWAELEHLKAVRMFAPTVGPWSPVVARLRRELQAVGVSLHLHRRLWDQLHWPHASGGFFSFRKHLAARLGAK